MLTVILEGHAVGAQINPVTHEVGHMLGGVWGHAPPETFEIFTL